MCDDENVSVVIDCGYSTCKAGLSGDEKPSVIFPSNVGHARCEPSIAGFPSFVGYEANRVNYIKKYPIQHGIVANWDDMEEIWKYIFLKQLHVEPSEHPVLLSEIPYNWNSHRQKTTQIMFESFDVAAMYLALQPVLSIYASGSITGTVIDSGKGTSHIVPIYEGYAIRNLVSHFILGGLDVTEYLNSILTKRGCSFTTNTVRDIKEKHCYVAIDYKTALARDDKSLQKIYKLPDGTEITTAKERFKCPEILFQPSMNATEIGGLYEFTYNCIMKSDVEIRKNLFSNIVLSGGNTLFPGFKERLQKEITALATIDTEINVVSKSERQYSVWIGGSILASLSTFQQMWITQQEYDEHGPSIVDRKCF